MNKNWYNIVLGELKVTKVWIFIVNTQQSDDRFYYKSFLETCKC